MSLGVQPRLCSGKAVLGVDNLHPSKSLASASMYMLTECFPYVVIEALLEQKCAS